MIRCNPLVLSKLMGTVRILPENDDIGLGIKFDKRGLCLAGFARKNSEDRWEYSQSAIDCARAYAERYPDVFRTLTADANSYTYEATAIFPPSSKAPTVSHQHSHGKDVVVEDEAMKKAYTAESIAKVKEIHAWIKTLPCSKAPYVAANSEALSPDAVSAPFFQG